MHKSEQKPTLPEHACNTSYPEWTQAETGDPQAAASPILVEAEMNYRLKFNYFPPRLQIMFHLAGKNAAQFTEHYTILSIASSLRREEKTEWKE